MGEESAPRWVRVVGYPPCPTSMKTKNKLPRRVQDNKDDDCTMWGFDIYSSIDLGTLEYRKINTDEKEKEEEEYPRFQGDRRRSIQTFAVNGGMWKPPLLFDEDGGTSSLDDGSPIQEKREEEEEEDAMETTLDDDHALEFVAPGQCAPPKDENLLPSCGGDDTTTTTTSTTKLSSNGKGGVGDRRSIVKAVSFVVEDNWGNTDYTCLYRVRVHGDPVLADILP